jgi:hypothetical protein
MMFAPSRFGLDAASFDASMLPERIAAASSAVFALSGAGRAPYS